MTSIQLMQLALMEMRRSTKMFTMTSMKMISRELFMRTLKIASHRSLSTFLEQREYSLSLSLQLKAETQRLSLLSSSTDM